MIGMNVLLNFGTLKKGGGQNVALNFLSNIDKVETKGMSFYYAVVENSEIHNFLIKKGITDFFLLSNNPVKRILQEYFNGRGVVEKQKIDVIYTYFGIGLYPKKIPQISGSADSNIYFPEINFWSDYKGLNKLVRYLIDRYRIWGVKRAYSIIFENDIMQSRALSLFGIKKSVYIKPSISLDYKSEKLVLPIILKDVKKGLFLCGWHKNKNVLRIPLIAFELKKKNIPFNFIITAKKDSSNVCKEFLFLLEKYGVQEYVTIIGGVKKEYIKSLYDQIDVVFLMSKLESFSNNIIESWAFSKPMILSDELWSRSICNKAGVYVDRENQYDIAIMIERIISDNYLVEEIIKNGQKELSLYPKLIERTQLEINHIREVYEAI